MKGKKTPNYFEDSSNDLPMDSHLSKKAYKILSKDPEVSERYNNFKESKIVPKKIKKYIFNKYDINISDISSVILSTSCKIFIGEIVEKARQLMSKDKLNGPIPPKYYKMAYKIVTEDFKGDLFKDNPYTSLLLS